MAKVSSKESTSKLVFGVRRIGKARKRKSPKDKYTKPSRGQG